MGLSQHIQKDHADLVYVLLVLFMACGSRCLWGMALFIHLQFSFILNSGHQGNFLGTPFCGMLCPSLSPHVQKDHADRVYVLLVLFMVWCSRCLWCMALFIHLQFSFILTSSHQGNFLGTPFCGMLCPSLSQHVQKDHADRVYVLLVLFMACDSRCLCLG